MLRIYVGWDPRDELAYRACVASLAERASVPVEIVGLREHRLRAAGIFWRSYHVEPSGQMVDDRDGRVFSTQFSFARFAIPLLEREREDRAELALFCDADMLWRRDVGELAALAAGPELAGKALLCVQHDHQPPERRKMDGVAQTRYARKNWSSLMLMRPALCPITRYQLNNWPGSQLHGLYWIEPSRLGELPEAWNWLEGWSAPDIDPAVVHYTRGTPDMLADRGLPFAEEWWRMVRAYRPEMEVTWCREALAG